MKKAIGVTGLLIGGMFVFTGFSQSADGGALAKKLPAQSTANGSQPVNKQKGALASKFKGSGNGNQMPGDTTGRNHSVRLGTAFKPAKESYNKK